MSPRVRNYAGAVAAEHGVALDALLSRRRSAPLWRARRDLYRRLADDGFTSGQIGAWVGRDGSTVRAALTRGAR